MNLKRRFKQGWDFGRRFGLFFSVGEMTNNAYQPDEEAILILYKNGKLKDIRDASDINLEGLTKTVRKHFVCYPAKISLGN